MRGLLEEVEEVLTDTDYLKRKKGPGWCDFFFKKLFFFKKCGPFLMSLIEFITILLLLYVHMYIHICFFCLRGMWDLSSLTRDQTCTSYIGRQSVNHWTTREVPRIWLWCQLVEGGEWTRVRNVWENSVPDMKLFFGEVILSFGRNSSSFGNVSPLSNYLHQSSILGANLVQFQGKLKTGKRE